MHDPERIFFSYARTDADLVLRIAIALRKEGRAAWVDQLDIRKGSRWDDEVERALTASSCLVAVLSPASVASQNVMDEVSFALGEKKRVIPIVAQECVVPFRLRRLQHIDFVNRYESGFAELVAALDAPIAEVAAPQSPEGPPITQPGGVDSRVDVLWAAPETNADGSRGNSIRSRTLIFVGVVVLALVIGWVFAWPKAPKPDAMLATTTPTPAPAVPAAAPAASPAAAPIASAAVAAPPPPPPPPPEVVAAPLRKPEATPAVSSGEREIRDFVPAYLSAQKNGTPQHLLEYYAERVDYFDRNDADKQFILNDKKNYQKRWPEVENELVGPVRVERAGGEDAAVVSYDLRYTVRNTRRSQMKTGFAHDELRLRRVAGKWLIVGQTQKIVDAPGGR